LGSRNGHADISLARHSPAARQLAEKWVREGAVVEEFTLHARYAPSLRPVGTVRVLICDLPAGYEVQGITETLLTCAGYENASTLVVSEFLGTGVLASREVKSVGRSDFIVVVFFFLEFTRPKGTEILWEFTAGNLLEPAVMLNTTDEQHTLSQPTRRRANTANGKEGLKHASTLRFFYYFFLEFTRPKGTEILWEFTAGNLLEPAVMLNQPKKP